MARDSFDASFFAVGSSRDVAPRRRRERSALYYFASRRRRFAVVNTVQCIGRVRFDFFPRDEVAVVLRFITFGHAVA